MDTIRVILVMRMVGLLSLIKNGEISLHSAGESFRKMRQSASQTHPHTHRPLFPKLVHVMCYYMAIMARPVPSVASNVLPAAPLAVMSTGAEVTDVYTIVWLYQGPYTGDGATGSSVVTS